MEEGYFSAFLLVRITKNPGGCTQNEPEKLLEDGGKYADGWGNSGPEDNTVEKFSGFSFCLICPKLDTGKTRNFYEHRRNTQTEATTKACCNHETRKEAD